MKQLIPLFFLITSISFAKEEKKKNQKAITALFCPICIFELSKSNSIKKKTNRIVASEKKDNKKP